MNSPLFIPAFIALGFGILSGCGGSSSGESSYLPIGLQRMLSITLPNAERPYIFGFITESSNNATIYTGTSAQPSTASIHVVKYDPGTDTAEKIGFYWSSNYDSAPTGLNALVVLHNATNVSKGIGSATCSVKDAEYEETVQQQDNCRATITDFMTP